MFQFHFVTQLLQKHIYQYKTVGLSLLVKKKDLDVNDVCSKVNAAFLKAVLPFLSRVENEAINGIEEST